MNIDGSPGVMRRLIAFGLLKLRKEARLSQAQAAKHMRRAQGSIANWENQANLPRLEVIEKLLRVYGAEDQIPKYTELLELAEQKSWWEGLSETRELAGFDTFLGLEEGASKIESFDPLLVPGLLQTEPYARAVTRGGQRTDVDLDRKVALRMKRQEALHRPNPLHLWTVIEEAALDRPIGDAETRRGQFEHLVAVSQRPNVQIQVIPREVGAHPALTGPFEIMHFPMSEDPGVVYVETKIKAVWFEEQAEIDQYTQVMNHLRALALAPEKSSALIEDKQKEVC